MASVQYLQRDQPPGVPPLALTGERTLPDVPEENYWYRRHLVVYRWIAERVAGRRVIDMACGEGYGADALASSARSVTGVDANPEAHEHARLRYRGGAGHIDLFLRGKKRFGIFPAPVEALNFYNVPLALLVRTITKGQTP